jgi:hypothetical protein
VLFGLSIVEIFLFHFWIKIAMKHIGIAKQKNKKIFNKNLKPFSESHLEKLRLSMSTIQYIDIK